MKLKKEFIVLFVLIAAISTYLIMNKYDKTHYDLPEISVIPKKNFTKIEVINKDAALVFNKKDNNWHIEPDGYKADSDKIDHVLDIIGNLTLTALVAQSKSYSRYNLDDSKKITVRAWSNDRIVREFEVGKNAATTSHTFVKLADDEQVYLAENNFRNNFEQTSETFRNKIVLAFEQNKINKISIESENQTMVLEQKQVPEISDKSRKTSEQPKTLMKTALVWLDQDGKKVNENRLNRMITALSKLSCEKYIKDGKKEDFNSPIYTIRLIGLKEYSLSIFEKKDKNINQYPAVSSENDYPFMLPEYKANNIMLKPDEIIMNAG